MPEKTCETRYLKSLRSFRKRSRGCRSWRRTCSSAGTGPRAPCSRIWTGAVEAVRRQSAPAASLREPGGAESCRPGPGLSRALPAGAARLRRLHLGAAAIGGCAARRVLLRGVWLPRELPDLFRRPRRARRRSLQGRQRRAHEFRRRRPALRAGLLHADASTTTASSTPSTTSTIRATCPSSRCSKPMASWLKVTRAHRGAGCASRALWKAHVGRISVYLLDTNCPENAPADRDITYRLYGGDESTRIRQEMILGIGGMRAVRALGLQPARVASERRPRRVPHSGAAARAPRARLAVQRGARSCGRASARSRRIRRWPRATTRSGTTCSSRTSAISFASSGLPLDRFLELGRAPSVPGLFNMTRLALNGTRSVNGVSRIHGVVSSRLCCGSVARDPARKTIRWASSRTAFTCRRSCIRRGQTIFDQSLAARLARAPARRRVLACHRASAGRAVTGPPRSP